jgi:hypothetical protein
MLIPAVPFFPMAALPSGAPHWRASGAQRPRGGIKARKAACLLIRGSQVRILPGAPSWYAEPLQSAAFTAPQGASKTTALDRWEPLGRGAHWRATGAHDERCRISLCRGGYLRFPPSNDPEARWSSASFLGSVCGLDFRDFVLGGNGVSERFGGTFGFGRRTALQARSPGRL